MLIRLSVAGVPSTLNVHYNSVNLCWYFTVLFMKIKLFYEISPFMLQKSLVMVIILLYLVFRLFLEAAELREHLKLKLDATFFDTLKQSCHGQGKISGKWIFFQVREKSGNFVDGQGNIERTLKVGEKSGNWKINGYGSLSLGNLLILFKRGKDLLSHEVV